MVKSHDWSSVIIEKRSFVLDNAADDLSDQVVDPECNN